MFTWLEEEKIAFCTNCNNTLWFAKNSIKCKIVNWLNSVLYTHKKIKKEIIFLIRFKTKFWIIFFYACTSYMTKAVAIIFVNIPGKLREYKCLCLLFETFWNILG